VSKLATKNCKPHSALAVAVYTPSSNHAPDNNLWSSLWPGYPMHVFQSVFLVRSLQWLLSVKSRYHISEWTKTKAYSRSLNQRRLWLRPNVYQSSLEDHMSCMSHKSQKTSPCCSELRERRLHIITHRHPNPKHVSLPAWRIFSIIQKPKRPQGILIPQCAWQLPDFRDHQS
jgi:hypothetical protein